MVVCQWKTCGIFRYLVWPHTHTPARDDDGMEKKKNLGGIKKGKRSGYISVLFYTRRLCVSESPWLCVSEQ